MLSENVMRTTPSWATWMALFIGDTAVTAGGILSMVVNVLLNAWAILRYTRSVTFVVTTTV